MDIELEGSGRRIIDTTQLAPPQDRGPGEHVNIIIDQAELLMIIDGMNKSKNSLYSSVDKEKKYWQLLEDLRALRLSAWAVGNDAL